jgi:hypothetical protein
VAFIIDITIIIWQQILYHDVVLIIMAASFVPGRGINLREPNINVAKKLSTT